MDLQDLTLPSPKHAVSFEDMPRARTLDLTVDFLLGDGYRAIQKHSHVLGSDIFRTRLLFQTVVCVTGAEGAMLFYNSRLFQREGALPRRIQKTLLGQGAVHGMDGRAQQHRKQMFMSLMSPDALARAVKIAEDDWGRAALQWKNRRWISLFEEAQSVLCRTICAWAGIPLAKADVRGRASDLAAMIDAFGAVGPRHWRGRVARKRSEKWLEGLIAEVRSGRRKARDGSAIQVISAHRDLEGELLDDHTAAVELLNVVRPTVALAYLIAFAGRELHLHPEYREKIGAGDGRELECFVQEVRRHSPFAPVLGAIAREDVEWRGFVIPKGTLTILDLYGTNHDPRSWREPGRFWPERFKHWDGNPYTFIPQGGGDHLTGHRCAGEWLTIELLKVAVRFLAARLEYQVPDQDLSVPMNRMPTFPRSGFVMEKVRLRE